MEIRKYYEPMNQAKLTVWQKAAAIASPAEIAAIVVCMQVIVVALYFGLTEGV